MIEVAVKNLSSVVTDAQLAAAMPAFQTQVSRDFSSVWGIDARLHLLTRSAALPGGHWQLNVFDDADGAGYLGFHETTAKGLPLGKVFAKTTLGYGGLWSVTFSHELLEMLLDPTINLLAIDEHHQRAYAYEACDAVEADELGYDIHGVRVSDFVKPSFFEPDVAVGRTGRSFCGHVSKAFELARGGYLSFIDLTNGEWKQIDLMRGGEHAGKGSRAARRRTPVAQRRVSLAE
jgi:hypothetical protein